MLVDDYGTDTLVGGEGRDILRTWSGGDGDDFISELNDANEWRLAA